MGSPPHLPRVQPNGGWVGELSDRRPRREQTVATVVDARGTQRAESRPDGFAGCGDAAEILAGRCWA